MRHYAYARNIRHYLALATDEQRREGEAWYGSAAAASIEAICERTGLDFDTVAGAVALLSPRVRWWQNLRVAEEYCHAYARGYRQPIGSGLPSNRDKAWRWLHSRDYSIISGNKVTAFYRNLTGDEQRVTVDTWAVRAATRCKLDAVDSTARYYAVERAYQRVARDTEWTPAQLQAIVWVVIRQLG
jgi:hypothetical protein